MGKKIIDLTYTITEDMPVYPGTEQPTLNVMMTHDEHGFQETMLNILSHTGTHMDAPAHLYAGRTTLDAFPIEQFCGTALVVDCTELKAGQTITMDFINCVKDKASQAEFILFRTGWDEHWGSPQYYGEYPCVNDDVIEYLISSQKKGVGFDVIGLDPVNDANLTLHRKLLSVAEIVVIENLANLGELGGELFTFVALPIKYANADGAPIRAIAMLD